MLNCPPYAAVYLGAEGGLGGEAADRAAGFWRALGVAPPAEPDHLTALLGLYASLGEAAGGTRTAATADALTRARQALFWEHLWPWLPGYLAAVADLGTPGLGPWARLAGRVLRAERGAHPGGWLPLALRAAPAAPAGLGGLNDLLDMLTCPVRSGLILTRRGLAGGADAAGAGHRIGERRFTLRALLDQAPAETLGWLAGEAARLVPAARQPGGRPSGRRHRPGLVGTAGRSYRADPRHRGEPRPGGSVRGGAPCGVTNDPCDAGARVGGCR